MSSQPLYPTVKDLLSDPSLLLRAENGQDPNGSSSSSQPVSAMPSSGGITDPMTISIFMVCLIVVVILLVYLREKTPGINIGTTTKHYSIISYYRNCMEDYYRYCGGCAVDVFCSILVILLFQY